MNTNEKKVRATLSVHCLYHILLQTILFSPLAVFVFFFFFRFVKTGTTIGLFKSKLA